MDKVNKVMNIYDSQNSDGEKDIGRSSDLLIKNRPDGEGDNSTLHIQEAYPSAQMQRTTEPPTGGQGTMAGVGPGIQLKRNLEHMKI